MFSSIRDAILDRTNRARENQQSDNADKHDFVIVDLPRGQHAQSPSDAGDIPQGEKENMDTDSDESSDSGVSTLPASQTSSQRDDSFRAWRFMQCARPSLASTALTRTI